MYSGLVTEAGVPPVAWPPAGAAGQDPAGSEGVDNAEATHEPPAPTEKQKADDEVFFLRMLKPFLSYQPVLDALRSGTPRVVIGIGAASHEEIPARSCAVLAEQLGTAPIPFPGDHAGFMADPAGFARTISEVLSATAADG
jgi:hypothetical protein